METISSDRQPTPTILYIIIAVGIIHLLCIDQNARFLRSENGTTFTDHVQITFVCVPFMINILKIRNLKSVGGSIDSVDPGWINDQQSTIAVEMITVEMITLEMIAVEVIASCVDPGGDQ